MLSVRSRISSTLKVCRMRVIDASIGRAAADYVFHMALINQGRHPVREEALINQASCGSQGACVCLYLLVDTLCHVLLYIYIHTYQVLVLIGVFFCIFSSSPYRITYLPGMYVLKYTTGYYGRFTAVSSKQINAEAINPLPLSTVVE